MIQKNQDELNIHFFSTIKYSKLLIKTLHLFLAFLLVFFFLNLLDFLLDLFSARGGFIDYADGNGRSNSSAIQDLLIIFLGTATAVFLVGFILLETRIQISKHGLHVQREVFGLVVKKTSIPLSSIKDIMISFETTQMGEFAFLKVKTADKEYQFQIYDSDPRIPSEAREELREVERDLLEFFAHSS